MVRFIIRWFNDSRRLDRFIYIPIWLDLLYIYFLHFALTYKIYIPIWLDLLLKNERERAKHNLYLHSNMVRFIIDDVILSINELLRFTFQYG